MPKPPKDIKAFKHSAAKRAHIPSAEEAGSEAASPAVKGAPAKVEIPLNPVVHRGQDPELFWLGKYGDQEDAGNPVITVDLRSIYRHEHTAPEKIIKTLHRMVEADETQPDLLNYSLRDSFGNATQHDELEKTSHYYNYDHADGWTNRLMQGDSLLCMASMLHREGMAGQVQTIYFDPPYGIKYGSNWQIALHDRTVTDGNLRQRHHGVCRGAMGAALDHHRHLAQGTFQVSIVRMHGDLLQDGLMKKDKKHASFVTIGEPDIGVSEVGVSEDGKKEIQVEIRGLDIYDPIKDEVKSRAAHDIAYWMVDDDYDGTNFVVKQVFFSGGSKDEFSKWKKGLDALALTATKKKAERTLRIEIDEEAFERLYGTVSHPILVKKPGQKIAVRVISQFGEETTKVMEV